MRSQRMSLAVIKQLQPQRLRRFRDIVGLFARYGRVDLLRQAGIEPSDVIPTSANRAGGKAEDLPSDLEQLGPTFVKLGQLLSTRSDLLPMDYIGALSRLQDRVEPFPYEQVEAIVRVEIGVRISNAFSSFEKEPMAAASLGQVHRATLRDGREVAVKVQRPDIREEMIGDLESLEEIAGLLDRATSLGKYQLAELIRQFRRTLLDELDYQREARNLVRMREALRDFHRIVIPAPVADYTTSRVLTMDFIRGRKITKLSPLSRLEFDGAELAEELFQAYLRQILIEGFLHADPHPGNVFFTDDRRIALIDLGMVAHVPERTREYLLQLLLAIGDGRGEDAAAVAQKIGAKTDDFDESIFTRRIADLVARQVGARAVDLQCGSIVLDVTQVAARSGIRVPPSLSMLGKTLLNLDEVGRVLDPDFDPNESIRRNAAKLMRQRMLHTLSPGNLFSGVIELKDLIARFPERINKTLESLASGSFRVKVDTIDEKELISGIQKVANRITLGLILAALIVGAALLMQVETNFRIFGYPGLAIICFLGAAAGGVALVVNILLHDR
jgi:ubiquinone biosynthesis protein